MRISALFSPALRVLIWALVMASSHSLFAQNWFCVAYQALDCGIVAFQSSCYGEYAEYYYEWVGDRYQVVGCASSVPCGSCSHPPCLCIDDIGRLIVNWLCAPCPQVVAAGGGSGGGSGGDGSGGGSGGNGSGGGGCDLCATLSQSNTYLNQILNEIRNLSVKIDLSEIIRRLDSIINNQGAMFSVVRGMADDLTAIRARLAGIDTQLMMLTDIVATRLDRIYFSLMDIHSRLGTMDQKLGSIDQKLDSIDQKLNKLDDIKSVLEAMRDLIELQGQKLDAIKDLISQVWDYLRDDQALAVMQNLTAAQLAYLDARLQYFYNALSLSVASYGELADLLYSTFASQYQRMNFRNDLIRVVGGGFVPAYNIAAEPDALVLYEAGLLSGAVAGWMTAVNTHYLPLASFPTMTIYLNLDHPEVFWARQILRLMIAVSFIFFFVKRRYEEVTALFAEVGDNA
jgi:archaellum component FlaC